MHAMAPPGPPLAGAGRVAARWRRDRCWRRADGRRAPRAACGPVTREALDPAYLVHVARHRRRHRVHVRPPDLGAPPAGPAGRRAWSTSRSPGRCRWASSSGATCCSSTTPTSTPTERAELEDLAGDGVVVAPNPDLPAPVVATAWLYKRTCDEVDAAALRGVHRRARWARAPRGDARTRGASTTAGSAPTASWHAPPPETIEASAPRWASPAGRPGAGWCARAPPTRSTHRAACTLEDGTDARRGPAAARRPPARHPRARARRRRTDHHAPRRARALPPPGRAARVGRDRAGADRPLVAQLGHRRPRRRARHRRRGSPAAAAGSSALSPLHAPTPVAPIPASPYYPSSRRWRSPLLSGSTRSAGADRRLAAASPPKPAALLADPIVRPRRVLGPPARRPRAPLGAARRPRARRRATAWRRAAGRRRSSGWATFCALAEVHGPSWRRWPADAPPPGVAGRRARRRPSSPTGVAFHAWLQQLVEEQLGAAGVVGRAPRAGPRRRRRPGRRRRLDAGRTCSPPAFSIGAPPDEFEPDGPVVGPAAVDPVAAARRGLPTARRRCSARVDGRAAAACASTT